MFGNFAIDNYRLFREFDIAPLARVNLIVGKNNSGKSALLEALEVFASRGSFSVLRTLVVERDETWTERRRTDNKSGGPGAFRHLFGGHAIPSIGSPGISLASGSQRVELFQAATQRTVNDDGTVVSKILSPEDFAAAQDVDTVDRILVARDGNRLRRIVRIEETVGQRVASTSPPDFEPIVSFQAVPTSNMTPVRLAALWDEIGLTPLSNEVIDGLRLIDPNIGGVLFVESPVRSARMPMISVTNSEEPLPLKSMGDGMTRLFHIIIALVTSKDGILIIDEFENGLHWSIQEAVWSTVFRLASHLNVQVFATTHSKDCVQGFERAWLTDREAGALFRLQSGKDGNPIAKKYSLETLADSLDTMVEVR